MDRSLSNYSSIAVPKNAKPSVVTGIFMATISVLSASSTVPFLDTYVGTSSSTRNLWRCELIVICCIPITYYLWSKHKRALKMAEIFSFKTLGELVLSGLLWLAGSILYIKSSDYTLVSHSILLCNSGGVLIILISLIRLLPVHKYEIFGTIVVVGACVFFINDGGSTKTGSTTNILYGDLMALASMPFFSMYYLVNSETLKKLPAMVILHLVNFIQMIVFIFIILYTSDVKTQDFFSFDPVVGLMGWASKEYLLFSVLLVAPLAGLIGAGSYIFMLDYFPSHIVASIFLLEPVTGQFLGIILGQDNFPGYVTYIGALGILFGLGLTIKGDRLKCAQQQEQEDLEMHLYEL